MPLDVTHKALTTAPHIAGFRAMGTKIGHTVAAWTDFFERFDKEKYGSEGRAAARPLRHRLSHPARALHRAAHQRRDRDPVRPHAGHDRRRLVARHRAARQCHVHGRHRCRRLLHAPDRTDRASMTGRGWSGRLVGAASGPCPGPWPGAGAGPVRRLGGPRHRLGHVRRRPRHALRRAPGRDGRGHGDRISKAPRAR